METTIERGEKKEKEGKKLPWTADKTPWLLNEMIILLFDQQIS